MSWGLDIPDSGYSAAIVPAGDLIVQFANQLNYMIWINVASGIDPVTIFNMEYETEIANDLL